MAPPPDAGARGGGARTAAAPVWAVAREEAMVIALSELNRWFGGWFVNVTRT